MADPKTIKYKANNKQTTNHKTQQKKIIKKTTRNKPKP
jgi:hypothetical protein